MTVRWRTFHTRFRPRRWVLQQQTPAAFSKLLANNSTWALIDRGSKLAYIPIWELIRELDCDFQVAADILEKTWIKDEEGHREAVREKVSCPEIRILILTLRTTMNSKKPCFNRLVVGSTVFLGIAEAGGEGGWLVPPLFLPIRWSCLGKRRGN